MTERTAPSEERVLTDVEYVVSDLHLNHRNIIEFCRDDRFAPTDDGLDDMNWTLLANWNRTVDRDDTVVFVGDFAWIREGDPTAQRKADSLWDTLNGEKVFVRGDHDHVRPSGVDWVYATTIRHDDRSYFVSHFPGDTPESLPGGEMPEEFRRALPDDDAERLDGWRIHGHHHNNWPDEYPLVNPQRRTINCSVELTDYRPLAMDTVAALVARGEPVDALDR